MVGRSRTVHLLTCLLALVTALALLGVGVVVGDSHLPDPPPRASATEAAVRGFYDAVNAAIRTGDATALDPVVAPLFRDHAPAPGVAPDRFGLTRSLAALHATMPDAEVVVADLVVVGDRALAWVTVHGAEHGTFLGLPLPGEPAGWGSLDVFRVADGQIVERWGSADGRALLEPFGAVTLGTPIPAFQTVALARLALPPGDRRPNTSPARLPSRVQSGGSFSSWHNLGDDGPVPSRAVVPSIARKARCSGRGCRHGC